MYYIMYVLFVKYFSITFVKTLTVNMNDKL
jgi:hypothetical protein